MSHEKQNTSQGVDFILIRSENFSRMLITQVISVALNNPDRTIFNICADKNWSDIVDNAEHYQAEWHKGFSTKDEAYNWILLQAGMRHNLNQNGVCSLSTLESRKFIFLDENFSKPRGSKHFSEHKKEPVEVDKGKEVLFKEFMEWYEAKSHQLN